MKCPMPLLKLRLSTIVTQNTPSLRPNPEKNKKKPKKTHILATAITPSRHVISLSFSFSISFLAPWRPLPTAAP